MKKTGQLTIDIDIPKINGTPIARYVTADHFRLMLDLLRDLGFVEGDEIWAKGTRGRLGDETVLFVTQVSKYGSTGLGGDIAPDPVNFTCKQCGTLNTGLPYIDLNHPPQCQNPGPPHRLKVF
jgi:hypothetical protein